jgi:predicted RNase H-like HicB family nuclease
MFMAEIPDLPGCRAWAETRDETLYILTGLAGDFIDLYHEDGEELPVAVVASEVETVGEFEDRILVEV